MLVADVPHAEEHGRDEGDNNHDHGAFQINGVAHMAAVFCDAVGREGKSLESLESRLQPRKLAAFREVGLDFVDEMS